jgi:hypothetical protein
VTERGKYGPEVTQDVLFGSEPLEATGPPVVAATDGSARPNPGHAAGAWYVSDGCWEAVAVAGTSTNNVGELVAIRALLEAVPPDRSQPRCRRAGRIGRRGDARGDARSHGPRWIETGRG